MFGIRDDVVELSIDDLRIGVTGAQPRPFVSVGVCDAPPPLKIERQKNEFKKKNRFDELFFIMTLKCFNT